MKSVQWPTTPGTSTAFGGSFTVSKRCHSCSCIGFDASIEKRSALDAEHDVNDVRERDIVLVRAVETAPAHVQLHHLFGNTAERVIESVDAQLCVCAVIGRRHLGEHLPAVGQIRIVDLQLEAGFDDRQIFDTHGLGDSEQEVFGVLVILVVQPVLDRARRIRVHERARDVEARDRSL